jgi:hypothetical protein
MPWTKEIKPEGGRENSYDIELIPGGSISIKCTFPVSVYLNKKLVGQTDLDYFLEKGDYTIQIRDAKLGIFETFPVSIKGGENIIKNFEYGWVKLNFPPTFIVMYKSKSYTGGMEMLMPVGKQRLTAKNLDTNEERKINVIVTTDKPVNAQIE